MVWIKICGITNKEDAIKVTDMGADALGFILSEQSVRKVEASRAKEIIVSVKNKPRSASGNIRKSFVGVFVNEKIDRVIKTAGELGLSHVQLSGDETVDYLKRIKMNNKNIKLIKLIRVSDDISSYEDILKQILEYKNLADLFLLDTYKENFYGGTGKSFNWELVRGISRQFPVIIAGGLDCNSVSEAIRITKPFGIDASTKLEQSPGRKDIKKVEIFIKNALKEAD